MKGNELSTDRTYIEDALLTPKEVSSGLGLALGTLNNWRCLGTGPKYIKIGGRVRYPVRDLTSWLQSRGMDTQGKAA